MDVRRWLLIVLCVFTAVVQAQEVPGKVMLASEEWSDYTNKDGTGLAWDVLRQVFEPAGINLQTRSVPYTRSVGLAQRGEVDGWVGSYRDEAEGVLYPHWNFDSDHIYALGLASTPTPTIATLGNYRLAWVRVTSTPWGWPAHRRPPSPRWVTTAWPGCAATSTRSTCPMCAVSTRSSVAMAFWQCCYMAVRTSTLMRWPRPSTCSVRRMIPRSSR